MPTGRNAMRMMQKMGVNLEELPGVTEVSIKTNDKIIKIENPAVSLIKMQGQNMFQVSGGAITEEESKVELNENDVKLVAEQTKKSITESRIALQESEGDLAKAILKLKGEKK